MDVSLMEEVDVPGERAGGKRAVLRVGRASTERDDVPRRGKRMPSAGEAMVATGAFPHGD